MDNEAAKKVSKFLENFFVEPKWVDKIVCEWSMNTGNPLGTSLQQEALVERLSDILSAELRGRFMEKTCGPMQNLGEMKYNRDGTETRTGIFAKGEGKDE